MREKVVPLTLYSLFQAGPVRFCYERESSTSDSVFSLPGWSSEILLRERK